MKTEALDHPKLKTIFPLAILTDEVSQDLNAVMRFCQENSVPGIEVRGLFGKAFKDLNLSEIKEIGSRCSAAGINIVGVASPVFKCDIDNPAEVKENVEIFKRSVEAASILNTDIVRVFAFFRKQDLSSQDEIRRAAEAFSPLFDIIKGTSIRIGIENEGITTLATGSETRFFLECLPQDSTQIGVVWDPCNVLYVDSKTDPVKDDLSEVIDRIIHVHVKDAIREANGKANCCIEVGKGSIDWSTMFDRLKQKGYKGWVTLETHWRLKNLSEKDLNFPGGASFSENAEQASKICIKNLQNILKA